MAQTAEPHPESGTYDDDDDNNKDNFDRRDRSYDIVEMLRGDKLVKVSAPMVRYSK